MKKKLYLILILGALMLSTTFVYSVSSQTGKQKKPVKSSIANINAQKQNVTNLNNSEKPIAAEKPVAPEKNPPGDIPDSQAFIKYTSAAGGYKLQVPEGWARTEKGAYVNFMDKFDGIKVEVISTSIPFTIQNIKNNQIKQMIKTGRAIYIKTIKEVKLSGGKAVIVAFDSNSEPNPVTNKQIRLENESYIFYKYGKLAKLTLWAPLGADNVDQWRFISHSFRW